MPSKNPRELDDLSSVFAEIAIRAGKIIMEIYTNPFEIIEKSDGSPVTQADALAETEIVKSLRQRLPGIQIVAEEACATRLETAVAEEFLLVDALDGTAEFVARRPEFTVNIALIRHRTPVAGCIYAPASGEIYIGGKQAFAGLVDLERDELPVFRPISARACVAPMIAALSRSHLDLETKQFLRTQAIGQSLQVGSSIKFCRIAEGRADIYPRFSRTMEWDIAAGHAILRAAGGEVLGPDGGTFEYGKVAQGFANGPFIARGSVEEKL